MTSNLDWLLLKSFRHWLSANDARLRLLPRIENAPGLSKADLLRYIAQIEVDGDEERVWRLLRELMEGETVRMMVRLEDLTAFLDTLE